MSFTCTEGTFRTFRARLAPEDALSFANVLPATLRALSQLPPEAARYWDASDA